MSFNRITKILENPFDDGDGTYKTKIIWSKSAVHTHLRKSGLDVILIRKTPDGKSFKSNFICQID